MLGNLKNESLFKSVFQATTEGVLVVDKYGTILMANPACKKLFSYNPDKLVGENLDKLIQEKYKKQLKNYTVDPKKTNVTKILNVFGVKKNGTEFSLEIRLNSTIIDDKSLNIAFLRDTSNRAENLLEIKQTNDKLLESNRKFDALINNVKGILFRCENNKDYTMHYISEGCFEITGYSYEDFKDGTISYGQLILEEDRNMVWENIQTAIKDKKPYDFEYRMLHKNGSLKYVWEKGDTIFNKQNKVVALEGFVTDVTTYKEQERTIKTNEAKMKALLEAIPDMMFIQDRKGNFLDWHAKSSEILFIPPEKFIGKNMKEVLPVAVYEKIKISHKDALNSGNLQIAEYSVQGKKGIEHYEARVVLMNNHGLLTIVRDVTKNKVKEAQLNIKNNALESASNSIMIADAQHPDLPIIYCNTAFEKITGYTKEEAYGKNCNFLQDDDRDQKEISIMKNAITNGEACNVVLRNYRKDGTLFWNDVTITPVYNRDDKLTHFIGVQIDVTKKIKEEHLKDQTRKTLELLAEDKPVQIISNKIIEIAETHIRDCTASILILDKVDKTLHKLASPNVPKAFSKLLEGLAIGPKAGSCGTAAFLKKEIIVTNIATNVLWEDYKDIRETALKNGIKACWSFPVLSSTNKVLGTFAIYSKHSRNPLPAEKGIIMDLIHLASVAIEKHKTKLALKENKRALEKYTQKLEEIVQERTQEVMATVQDLVAANLNLEDQILITKQAEGEAIKSKTLTAAVAKNFPKGFIALMSKNLNLVLAEGEALEQLGLKPLIFEGMTLDDVSVFSEERKTRIKEDISKTLSGKHLTFEIEYKNRYFAVNTAPLFDENNEIAYALMVYNDISEQKEIEFSIQNALKKEKELNELKSRFISMASHEFRTPLSAILTSAILIGKQNETKKEHKREKYVAQIKNNVNHLITILNDFLSLSKLEEGNIKAVNEKFEIIHFVKTLINESKINLKNGQQISFNITLEHLFVNLDAKLLRHIITNLLSNASKYAAENTTINFKITKKHNKVLIQIKDQGIGIPEDEQKQLFNRFFRAKNATNIEGTGLGLNIAKHYTELMDGTIGFVSTLNKGTTFWIQLPINDK